MDHVKRKRAAWRFDPRVLARLQKFVNQTVPQMTQTAVIEAALCDYLDRKEDRDGAKRAARR